MVQGSMVMMPAGWTHVSGCRAGDVRIVPADGATGPVGRPVTARTWSAIVMAAGLALSCSAAPNLHLEGGIAIAAPHDGLWCSLELRDARNPGRSAGVIGVRATERFRVTFTEGQEKIISDESTPLLLVVSCDGFSPAQRPVRRDPMGHGNDIGMIAMRPKLD